MGYSLAMAIYHKYKDDPNRSQWGCGGNNWYDIEVLMDDGNGNAIPAPEEYQFTKEECDIAMAEYIAAKRANPKLDDPPEGYDPSAE